jgi:hypothetical protein
VSRRGGSDARCGPFVSAWRPCLDAPRKGATMTTPERKIFRCAIYTRKSTEHNLDLEFNSLDAQRGLRGLYKEPGA